MDNRMGNHMGVQIEVTVAVDGETKVEVIGCPSRPLGRQCADLTRALEQALGEVAEDVKKPEFYRRAHQAQQQGAQQQGGAR